MSHTETAGNAEKIMIYCFKKRRTEMTSSVNSVALARAASGRENKIRRAIMLTRVAVIVVALVCVIGLGGCYKGNIVSPSQPETQLDKNWGKSFEAAKYNQTLNPEADKNLAPVEGIEGSVAERIMEDYKKGEQKKESRPSAFGIMTQQSQY
jgi:hypothetical protein